jgi:hypothetical protein
MLKNAARLGLAAALLASWAATSTPAQAQMVAFRDLTAGWRVPPERIATPDEQTCPQLNSTLSNGEVPDPAKQSAADGLQLEIVSVSPQHLTVGRDFTATVRLKNTDTKDVLIPSVADGEKLTQVSGDAAEEKYEVGDISFRLATGKKRAVPIFLNSAGALFANPDDKNTYVSLAPGNWMDIKLKATVECGLQSCDATIHPDEHAALTAWWYQRVLTHRVQGCNENHGSLKVRTLDSPPLDVRVRNSATPNSASHP